MRAVSSIQCPVSRSFVEGLKSQKLLSAILKCSVFLLFFFLNTGHLQVTNSGCKNRGFSMFSMPLRLKSFFMRMQKVTSYFISKNLKNLLAVRTAGGHDKNNLTNGITFKSVTNGIIVSSCCHAGYRVRNSNVISAFTVRTILNISKRILFVDTKKLKRWTLWLFLGIGLSQLRLGGWILDTASAAFFERRAEGWHWYQDSLSESEVKKEETTQRKEAQTPTQQIESQRKSLEQKLHAAIVEPTRENVTTYIIAQKALMDQSQRFSESWQRVVMTTPSLDETLVHPVDQSARHVYYDEQAKTFSQHMKRFSQEYGLFFFFRQNCAYCHNFAPIVKRFSQKYGWSVLPISLDGGILPEFPNARRDNGMAARLQITHVPALIALHPKTGKLLPLAYGMISESEIERRIEMLTKLSDKISHGGQK